MSATHTLAALAGKLMRPFRAGDDKLATHQPEQTPFQTAPALHVESPSFADGGELPLPLVGKEGVSPALRWTGVPADAEELVILCEDPDAPKPSPFVHWIVYGISPQVDELPQGATGPALPPGAHLGKASTMKTGYTGPMPPPGHGPHHYHFQLFALDHKLGLTGEVGRAELLEAMRGHVVAAGELVGVHENR